MDFFTTYLAGSSAVQMIGVLGFICYVAAFGALQLGFVDGNSMAYTLLNILAVGLVAVSLSEEFNLSSALIQGCWIIFGFIGLALRAAKSWSRTRALLNTTLNVEA
ncbi:MAG: hypothetical protein AAFO79_10700 [Pseudomonadota bacterium]